MRAVAVTPGRRDSVRLVEVPAPEPQPGEVVVRVLSVGICGTDRDIVRTGECQAPPGEDRLILGHESLGRVESGAGPLEEGDLVAAIVRRPDPVPCSSCARGEWDMCLNGRYTERGIKGRHGYLCDVYTEMPEYLVPVPSSLERVGPLLEPASIVAKGIRQIETIQRRVAWHPRAAVVAGAGPIGLLAAMFLRLSGVEVTVYDLAQRGPKVALSRELGCDFVPADGTPLADRLSEIGRVDIAIDATGHPSLVFEMMQLLAPAGIACLTGVSPASTTIEVAGARINRDLVLGNNVVFGTVNANRGHFELARATLERAESQWPGWLARLVTRRVRLDSYREALAKAADDVKVLVDV